MHLAGVAGRGMPGLAQLLVQGGWVVTGSEPEPSRGQAVARLRRLGVRVHVHAPHPGPGPLPAHRLVCGPEAGRIHPERLSAIRRGLPVQTPAQCLGRFLRDKLGVVVAGAGSGRDAGVAAAMIGWALARNGRDPTVVLGSHTPQLGGWARLGRGPHAVVEDVNGHAVAPAGAGPSRPFRLAVLLGDEDEDAGTSPPEAFRAAADSVAEGGAIVARLGCTAAAGREGRGVAVDRLAIDEPADWWAADLRDDDRGRFRFRVYRRDAFAADVRLGVPGRRHVLAALAAFAAGGRLGLEVSETRRAVEEFAGVSRDFECRGSYRGVTLIDDAGAGPSAVAATLRLGRRIYGGRRIWAILDPSPTAADPEAAGRLVDALATADAVLLASGTGAAPGRNAVASSAIFSYSEEAMARALAAAGKRAGRVSCLDDAILELDRQLEPGDVLVTLGAGVVGMISDAFIRRLPRDRPGR
jgi:UDP-N-acetylmuramate--alanine ligase